MTLINLPMRTTLIPALTLALALLAGGPVSADNQNGKNSQGSPSYSARGGGNAPARGSNVRASAAYGGYAGRGAYRGSPSYNYSGGSSHGHGYTSGGGNSHYTYAFASHPGWSAGHNYFWHGHHYGWYNNGWFIIDPYAGYDPYYYYSYPSYGYPDNYQAAPPPPDDNADAGSPTAQVQQALARMGYYRGAIDGIMGPNTRGAISSYQRDNNLHVTGTVNGRLMDALDLN